MSDPEVMFMLVTSLMKIAGKDMSNRQREIGEFMKRVETSSDYFTHKIAEGTVERYRRADRQWQVLQGTGPRRRSDPRPPLHLPQGLPREQRQHSHQKISGLQVQPAALVGTITRTGEGLARRNSLQAKQIVHYLLLRNIFEFKPGSRWGNPNQNH